MMSRYSEIVAELQKRFDEDQSRSTIGRMREIYSVLREMQRGGMKSIAIVQALNEMGFAKQELSVRVFDTYMHRIKKEEEQRSHHPNGPSKAKTKGTGAFPTESESEATNHLGDSKRLTRKQKGEITAQRYVGNDINPLLKKC